MWDSDDNRDAAKAAAKEEECRFQFEEWAHEKGMCLDSDFFSDAENKYVNHDTHFAYEIWLASRSYA